MDELLHKLRNPDWLGDFESVSPEVAEQAADEIERLRAALKPFAYYYDLNDCQDRRPNDTLEVPIYDLSEAKKALGDEQTAPQKEA